MTFPRKSISCDQHLNKPMSNTTVPSVTLETAVIMQIQEFANTNQPFSRYDITVALRNKCNNGELEIPSLECVNGNVRYDIRKSSVDSIFEELLQNGVTKGVPPINGQYDPVLRYRVFSVDTTNAVQSTPSVPTNSSTIAPNVVASAPVISQNNPVILSDSEIRRRINLYMYNCKKVGTTPTLKKIQSAIKRGSKSTGLSRHEIFNIISSIKDFEFLMDLVGGRMDKNGM